MKTVVSKTCQSAKPCSWWALHPTTSLFLDLHNS